MEYSINREKNWQTTVSITVSAKDVEANQQQAIKRIQKDVALEGFRKGKVPPAMIKKLFGAKVETESREITLENAWKQVFDENDFFIINDPQVQNLQPTEERGMSFDIVFDVRPELQVSGYEGLPVEKVIYEVTDADVDAALEDARQKNAMMYTSEEPAKQGDFVYADFQEIDNSGVAVIGQKFENQQIWLNQEDTELTPQLLGVKAGEQRRVVLKVKSQQSELIEQPEQPEEIEKIYQVTVNSVKERRLPELDDEFAKDISEFETIADLRDQVSHNLRHQAEHDSESAFENAIAEEMVKLMDLELPESMVTNYVNSIMEDFKQRNQNNPNFDAEQYRDVYRQRAEHDLKWHLIVEELKRQENFTATDEEVEAKLDHYKEHGEDGIKRAEAIRADEKEMERLRDSIVFDKLYAFLAQNAKVTEVTRPWRELHEPPAQDIQDIEEEAGVS